MAKLGFQLVLDEYDHIGENGEDIPAYDELRQHRKWVSWKLGAPRSDSGKQTKLPVNPMTGRLASSGKPEDWGTYEQAKARTLAQGLAGNGYVFTADDNYTAIDLDHCRDPDTGEFEPWAAEILAFEETYAEGSPSGTGVHMIARGKIERTIKCDEANVEMYVFGRYFTMTESQIDGSPMSIRPAPRTIAALLARIEANRPTPAPAAPATPNLPAVLPQPVRPSNVTVLPPVRPGNFFRNVNDAALANLDAWVPAVFPSARTQLSTGGYRIKSKALGRALEEDLGIIPTGIWDFGLEAPSTAISVVMDFGGAPDSLSGAKWLCAQMGIDPETLGFGQEDAAFMAEANALGEAILASALRADADDDVEPIEAAPQLSDADREFPEEYLKLPGILGEMMRYVLDSGGTRIPLFAAAASLMAVSTLMGRRLYYGLSADKTPTHLYMVGIMGTGGGKDHPQQALKRLLDAASGEHPMMTLHRTSVSSAATLGVHLGSHPLQCQIVDEISGLYAKMTGRNASSQESNLLLNLCTLWGLSDGTFAPESTMSRGYTIIKRPSLSIFGFTTPTGFYESLRSKHVAGGFLNRFLVLPKYQRVRYSTPVLATKDVPEGLRRRLQLLYDFQNQPKPGQVVKPGLPLMGPTDAEVPPEMTSVGGTPEAEARLAELADEQYDMVCGADTDPMLETWVRFTDMVRRLALIHAVGRFSDRDLHGIVVDLCDVTFAGRLVRWSLDTFVTGMRQNMVENEHQAEYKRVLGIIRTTGTIGHRELLRKLQGSIKARELGPMMDMMMSAGQVKPIKEPAKRGPPKVSYQFVRD
ncbi:hypothetical protein G3545_06280 [Starkeya sp. ORNL1]|uniref:hypothetical protein n=1 Tax=Starkeya sp. ORNL1 TaxID=2709380 RepID=UPI0014632E0E|nr:hypothetical protein [Starkeya sp. ORNL1]QJP13292.1 hypothetical protein G3545_06280 [Starkeya sp. ORNL1]